MLVSIIIIFSCLWAVLFYKVRDVFSPWSITLLVWILIITGYLTINHGLYSITDQFSTAVLLWVLSFTCSGFVVFKLTPSYNGPEWALNTKVVKFFALVALIVTPLALYKAVSFAMQGGDFNLLNAMRKQVVEDDSGFSLGAIAYFEYAVYVLLFVAADTKKHFNKWFFIYCWLLNFIFFLVIMSKLILFIGFLSTLYLFYVHGRISLRSIVILCLAFAFFGLLFTQFRSATDGDTDTTYTIMDLFGMYIISPIVAFCYENPNVSTHWGYETFRAGYHILEVLGFNHHGSFPTLRPYVYLPIPTNVYTVMAPFYNDFGYLGVALFGALEGGIFSWFYKKAQTGHTIARELYAYFVVIIALQFFDEHFFAGISKILQMTILIVLFHVTVTWKPKCNSFVLFKRKSETLPQVSEGSGDKKSIESP